MWWAPLNAAACYGCHVLDIPWRKNIELFEGAVVSLFAFDPKSVVKYVDAVSNCRLMDCLPSFVLERLTGVSVQCNAFSGFQ